MDKKKKLLRQSIFTEEGSHLESHEAEKNVDFGVNYPLSVCLLQKVISIPGNISAGLWMGGMGCQALLWSGL